MKSTDAACSVAPAVEDLDSFEDPSLDDLARTRDECVGELVLETAVTPTDVELWAIEADADLLSAELALVDAETDWYRSPGPETAAAYLAAVAEVLDLHELYGYARGPGRLLVGEVA